MWGARLLGHVRIEIHQRSSPLAIFNEVTAKVPSV
jgi:hypothetical protein